MVKVWKNLKESGPPPINKRKYYMVYHPMYTGYAFKCSYSEYGFAGIHAQTMITDVTHYRCCGKSEIDHQLSNEELKVISNMAIL